MNYTKNLVCLANSRKTTGRCFAGKEWSTGGSGTWVRPVSTRPSHEISEKEYQYQNGQSPQLLDIVSIPCDCPKPAPHQNENHVIDPKGCWERVACLPWDSVQQFADNPPSLWCAGYNSCAGLNNRVPVGEETGTSLYLVSVEKLTLLVEHKAPEYSDFKRVVRGQFEYQNQSYYMDVTDPVIEEEFLNMPDGRYDIKNPFLCISLSDPYQTPGREEFYYYKLIAAVLHRKRFE